MTYIDMAPIKQSYVELLNLTQLFLLREHSLGDIKTVDPAVLVFFQKKIKLSSPSPSIKKTQQIPVIPVIAQNTQIPVRAATIPPSPDPQPPQPRPEPTPPEPLPPSTQPEPVIPPTQPPAIQKNLGKTSKAKEFSLEPLTAAAPSRDFREFWKLCQTFFPEWSLSESTPSDAIAQKKKNEWLKNEEISPVVILSFHDNEQQLAFLKNIAQAISLRLAPAQVLSVSKLEKENSWKNVLDSPHLRLVIANDYGLYLQPKLMHFYREVPHQGKHFLNQIPLLLLSDLSLYLKEPQLKPLLWRAICNEFSALQSQQTP